MLGCVDKIQEPEIVEVQKYKKTPESFNVSPYEHLVSVSWVNYDDMGFDGTKPTRI